MSLPDSTSRGSDAGTDAPSDAELVRRALAGDDWAESAIYRRYAADIANLAMRLLGNRADAKDVMQDVFAQALLELDALREPSSLRAWLRRCAVHKVHRRFRRRTLRRMLGLDRDIETVGLDALASPACSPEDRMELRDISNVLNRLPARQRTAWVLVRIEGESLAVAARTVGRSLATVKRDVAAAQVAIEAELRSEP